MKSLEEFSQLQKRFGYTKRSLHDLVHIGLVQLSTDHSLEIELNRLAENQAHIFSSRVYFNSILEAQSLVDIATNINRSANLIATGLPMDVMAFGCTSATIAIGEKKVHQLLTERRNDIPSTNPWSATKAACHHLGCKNIAVLSPYPTAINHQLYQQLSEAGFNVTAFGTFDLTHDTDVTAISRQSIIRALEKLLPGSRSELVFVSCTNMRLLDLIEEIEQTFHLPALSSNSALFWHAMHLAGKPATCSGFGQLLKGA